MLRPTVGSCCECRRHEGAGQHNCAGGPGRPGGRPDRQRPRGDLGRHRRAAQGLPRSPADEGEPGLTHMRGSAVPRRGPAGPGARGGVGAREVAAVAPDQGLPRRSSPDGFDDPNTLAAFVDAVRWGAVTSADGNSFQAPFRSGANVEAYQLEPLRRALQSAADQPAARRRRGPGQDDRGRAWSSRSCCCGTAPGPRSSSARRACR